MFKMLTSERLALIMLAVALSLWALLSLCSRQPSDPIDPPIVDTVIIEHNDSIIPDKSRKKDTTDKVKAKKEKKQKKKKESKPKKKSQKKQRSHLDEPVN